MGSKVCAGCHRAIFDSYTQTGMGRSMSLASEPVNTGRVQSPVIVPGAASDTWLSVFLKDGSLFQSSYKKNLDETEQYRVTRRLEYAVGSGLNGTTYLTHEDGFLYEAPLSYFSKVNRWEKSPGYDKGYQGFNRPILAPCVSCHSGAPQTDVAANGRFATPPFRELAIGCENCHGPGQLHVAERSRNYSAPAGIDRTIVNPAKLSARLAENICMRCHQGGDTAVLQPGKEYSDFRPGTWLSETLAILKLPRKLQPPGLKPDTGAEVLEHFTGMNLSKCYRSSAGKLSCLTCHDPHASGAPGQVSVSYRSKCLQCHSQQDCQASLQARNSTKPADDCVGCHMPKRDLRQFSHSALTDHRIPRVPSQPYADQDFQQPTPDLPDLVFVNRPPDQVGSGLSDLVKMQAYGGLLADHPEYRPQYQEALGRLAAAGSKDSLVLSAIGRGELARNTAESDQAAVVYLRQSTAAGNTDPKTYAALAEALARRDQPSQAIDVLRRGLQLAPWDESLYKFLALRLIRLGRIAEARATVQSSVARFPEDEFMRNMLIKLESLPPMK